MKVNFERTKWGPHARKLYSLRVRRLYKGRWSIRVEFWRYSFIWDIFV